MAVVLFAFAVAAVASLALSEPLLEDALALNDECYSSDDEAACALNALQLRGQKQASSSTCSPQDQWCGDSYAEKDCCGDNTCVQSGGIFECKASVPAPAPPQCMEVGQACGGSVASTTTPIASIILRDYEAHPLINCYSWHGGIKLFDVSVPSSVEACAQRCNANALCLGFVFMRSQRKCWMRAGIELADCEVGVLGKQSGEFSTFTKKQQQALATTGPGQLTQTCCGTATCQQFYGGGGMQCAEPPPQCVDAGQVCGGPGQLTQTCCGNAKCQQFYGGSSMRCVESPPQCVDVGQVCGGPGQLTQTCCGTAKCEQLYGGDAMKCVEYHPACVGSGGSCGDGVECCSGAGVCGTTPWWNPDGPKTCQ